MQFDDYNSIKDQLEKQQEIIFDFNVEKLSLISHETQTYFKYAVLTKKCLHYAEPIELGIIIQKRRCPKCNAIFKDSRDLVKSPTQWAIQKFYKQAEYYVLTQCSIIRGYCFQVYEREKKFYQILEKNDVIVKYLMEKKNFDLVLSKLCNQKLSNSITQNFAAQYEAICLLNSFKIHIPVRHQYCEHLECYDLMSLLEYAQELDQKKAKKKFMRCCKDSCKVRIPMDLESIKQQFVVDFELFDLLRSSPSFCLEFYYSTKTGQFHHQQNLSSDEHIQSYFIQRHLQENWEIYQFVYQKMALLLQTNTSIQNIQKRNKYRIINNINLKDPFLQHAIQYPARCINCPLNKCSDLRTYLCEIQLTLKQNMNFKCPLCNKTYNFKLSQLEQLTNSLYLDFNLYQKIIQDKKQIKDHLFNYEGDRYLLQNFQQRSVKKQKTIKLFQQEGRNKIEYNNLKCAITKKRLVHPLLLVGCQLKNYIDFTAYYSQLEKIDFNPSHGLKFCNCEFCMNNPIYLNDLSLLFDDLFAEVLVKLIQFEEKTKKKYASIIYDINTDELEEGELNQEQTQIVTNTEYQKKFNEQLLEGQYAFQIKEVRKRVSDNQTLIFTQQGVTKMQDDEIQKINENLANHKIYHKYNMIIRSVQYKLELADNLNIE